MTREILLWIDDERTMPVGFTHWVKTSNEAIEFLTSLTKDDHLALVSFDHDLGYDPTDGHPKLEEEDAIYDTSRPVATWMVKNNVFPSIVMIHTVNPIGARWLYETFKNDGPEGLAVARAPYNPKNYTPTGNTGHTMSDRYHK